MANQDYLIEQPSISKDHVKLSEYPIIPSNMRTLLWLDSKSSTEEYNETKYEKIKSMFAKHTIFNQIQHLQEFINQSESTEIILIISTTIGMEHIAEIHKNEKVDSIYVLGLDGDDFELTKHDFKKIRGVFRSLEQLLAKLEIQINMNELCEEMNGTKLYNDTEKKKISWFSLLKIVLFSSEILPEPTMMHNFEQAFQIPDSGSKSLKESLANFYRTRDLSTILQCYNDEFMFRSTINNALINRNISQLFALRFILFNISRMISKDRLNKVLAYKTQPIPLEKIQKMTLFPKQRIRFESFLTASTKQYQTEETDFCQESNALVHVHLKAENSARKMPFAQLPSLSTSLSMNSQDDIIFMCGSVFEIEKLENVGGSWNLELNLVENPHDECDDETIKNFTIKRDFSLIGDLLAENGEMDKAKEYYNQLLCALPKNDPNYKQIETLVSSFVLPKDIVCVVYNLQHAMSDFSREVLSMIKEYAGNQVMEIEQQPESIEPSFLKDKNLSFYTINTSMKELRKLFPGQRILALEDKPAMIDNQTYFGSIEVLVSHLCDQIIDYCSKKVQYHINHKQHEEANRFSYKIKNIRQCFSFSVEQKSQQKKNLNTDHQRDPVLVWLKSLRDRSNTYEYVKEMFGNWFQAYYVYSDPTQCENLIKEEKDRCIYLVMAKACPNETRKLLTRIPSVLHSFAYFPVNDLEKDREELHRTLIFDMGSALINRFEETARFYQVKKDREKYRENLVKAQKMCDFMSEKFI